MMSNTVIAAFALCSFAQAQGQAPALQQKLESQYTLTQPTADNTDIVTAGSVLVLQKNGLTAGAVGSKAPVIENTYKDGQIKTGKIGTAQKIRNFGIPRIPTAAAGVADTSTRSLVQGEKVYVTKIGINDNEIDFDLISSEVYNNVRYRATLKFEYPKGSTPSADAVSQVFTVVAADSQDAKAQQQIAPAPAPPAEEPQAPPQTVELGQTTDQVVAILGQPQRIAKVGTKQIYYYKDLKVTFVDGKASDIQ